MRTANSRYTQRMFMTHTIVNATTSATADKSERMKTDKDIEIHPQNDNRRITKNKKNEEELNAIACFK